MHARRLAHSCRSGSGLERHRSPSNASRRLSDDEELGKHPVDSLPIVASRCLFLQAAGNRDRRGQRARHANADNVPPGLLCSRHCRTRVAAGCAPSWRGTARAADRLRRRARDRDPGADLLALLPPDRAGARAPAAGRLRRGAGAQAGDGRGRAVRLRPVAVPGGLAGGARRGKRVEATPTRRISA